jgi:hypothetical protein
MVGTVLGAHYLMNQAVLAKQKLAAILEEKGLGTDDKKAYKEFLEDNEEAAFYHNKVQTAIHFAYRALPTVAAKGAAIRSGEKTVENRGKGEKAQRGGWGSPFLFCPFSPFSINPTGGYVERFNVQRSNVRLIRISVR